MLRSPAASPALAGLVACTVLLHPASLPGQASPPAGHRPTPELFGEGVFTTAAWDFFVAFTPDQKTAFFCRANANFTYYTILWSVFEGGRWREPKVAPFSGRWSDADPHVSPDGSRLFFISNRPMAGSEAREHYDIWYVDRQPNGTWGEPVPLGAPVNADDVTEWSPTVAANGNVYFGAVRKEGKGGNDLYVSRWSNGSYGEPENLGDSINTRAGEVEPWIAPDESYLIFSGQGRPDGLGGFDLYLSLRKNGVWQSPRHLPPEINSSSGDFNQSVSPDGQYLYFSSTRGFFDRIPGATLEYPEMQRRLTGVGNGLGDIYRIPLKEVLDQGGQP